MPLLHHHIHFTFAYFGSEISARVMARLACRLHSLLLSRLSRRRNNTYHQPALALAPARVPPRSVHALPLLLLPLLPTFFLCLFPAFLRASSSAPSSCCRVLFPALWPLPVTITPPPRPAEPVHAAVAVFRLVLVFSTCSTALRSPCTAIQPFGLFLPSCCRVLFPTLWPFPVTPYSS